MFSVATPLTPVHLVSTKSLTFLLWRVRSGRVRFFKFLFSILISPNSRSTELDLGC